MQRYRISHFLSKEIAKKSSAPLRNALRLYFWLKTHGYSASFYRRKVTLPFTDKQQTIYFRTLIEYGIMGRDKHGKYYLRGRRWFFKQSGNRSRMSAVVVEPHHTESAEAWRDFLRAVWTLSVQRTVKRGASKVEKWAASTPDESGGNSGASRSASPLALSCVAKAHGVSVMTAHRWMKSACRAGHMTRQRQFKRMGHLFSITGQCALEALKEHLRWALPKRALQIEEFAQYAEVINPNAIRLSKDGTVVQEMPALVDNLGIVFRTISKGN